MYIMGNYEAVEHEARDGLHSRPACAWRQNAKGRAWRGPLAGRLGLSAARGRDGYRFRRRRPDGCRWRGSRPCPPPSPARKDRKSVVEGKTVLVRVDLGGRRNSKKKRTK